MRTRVRKGARFPYFGKRIRNAQGEKGEGKVRLKRRIKAVVKSVKRSITDVAGSCASEKGARQDLRRLVRNMRICSVGADIRISEPCDVVFVDMRSGLLTGRLRREKPTKKPPRRAALIIFIRYYFLCIALTAASTMLLGFRPYLSAR